MAKTPEQIKADAMLEEAVQAAVRAYDLTPQNSMITDYMVLGEAAQFLEDGDNTCELFIAFRNGHCRLTTVMGLMNLGERHLMKQWDHEDDRPDA